MSEWSFNKLENFFTLKRGYDLPKQNRVLGNIPVISSSGQNDFHIEAKINESGVITGRYGTIGSVYFSEIPFWPLNTTLYVNDFKGNDKKFIYYFLQTLDWEKFSDKSAVPGVNRNDVHQEMVSFPSSQEQQAIASVLSALDDKIDLLQRQNQTLEQMAATLFRQWFIESDGDNEITIDELIDFNPKRSLSKNTQAMYLEMAGLSTHSFNATGYYERVYSSGTKFKNQDTLLARITPCLENGKACYVHFLQEDEIAWGSTEYIVMRPKDKLHPFFAYVLSKDDSFREYAESCMEGSSGRQRVNINHLVNFTVVLPNESVIQKFNDFLETIEQKLIYNAKQIPILESLRDTLLPKLISGEVRLKGFETLLQA